MSHPLSELRKLLAPKGPKVTGSVVKLEAGTVHVATDRGVVVAERRGDTTSYQTGDRVILKSGELAGRLKDEDGLLVFFV